MSSSTSGGSCVDPDRLPGHERRPASTSLCVNAARARSRTPTWARCAATTAAWFMRRHAATASALHHHGRLPGTAFSLQRDHMHDGRVPEPGHAAGHAVRRQLRRQGLATAGEVRSVQTPWADCPAQSTSCAKSTCPEQRMRHQRRAVGHHVQRQRRQRLQRQRQHVRRVPPRGRRACLQMCIANNMLPYDNFVGLELESCGCMTGGPCASVCTAACANPSTLTGASPCGMCSGGSGRDGDGPAVRRLGGEQVPRQPSTCRSPFVSCGLACP